MYSHSMAPLGSGHAIFGAWACHILVNFVDQSCPACLRSQKETRLHVPINSITGTDYPPCNMNDDIKQMLNVGSNIPS